eukprot:TRINITY_DN32732_c0_g1_i1.p1 TRINITY_DN32732_c0_g1~~TRINITY_DN32732_c0_g1_i1.p1  ORF type:complete len:773 (-),score=82.86 TRINITY_DN32732_c0_g1_i1:19-2289(-)
MVEHAAVFAGLGAAGQSLFNYNKANYQYNRGQDLTRDYAAINFRLQHFALYRQDIRDIVALTTTRMNTYHVVVSLELGMCVTMIGPARLPENVPQWVVWQSLAMLCGAFAYLCGSLWLSTLAAVCAESLNARLQTQYVRLPFPDAEELDSALTRAQDFEKEPLHDLVRMPFSARLPKLHSCERATGDPLYGTREQQPPGPLTSMHHLKLYQQMQQNWQRLDAYSRVCMTLGTHWLMLSLAQYSIGFFMCSREMYLPAAGGAFTFVGIALLMTFMDLKTRPVSYMWATFLVAASPILTYTGLYFNPGHAVVPWQAIATGLSHAMLTMWFWYMGWTPRSEAALPTTFRAVHFLDIFGPLIKETRAKKYFDYSDVNISDSDDSEDYIVDESLVHDATRRNKAAGMNAHKDSAAVVLPYAVFNGLNLGFVILWIFGATAQVYGGDFQGAPIRLLSEREPLPAAASLTFGAEKLMTWNVSWPDPFFSPRAAMYPFGAHGNILIVSNGFVLYQLEERNASGLFARALRCPVDAHDAVVAASCAARSAQGAQGDACSAVVAASGSIWRCGAEEDESSERRLAGRSTLDAAVLVASLQRSSALHKQTFRYWVAADEDLSVSFAAASDGSLYEFRKYGTSLLPVAKVPLPHDLLSQFTWEGLAVFGGELLAILSVEGVMSAVTWTLSTGATLGLRQLSTEATSSGSWLAFSRCNGTSSSDEHVCGIISCGRSPSCADGLQYWKLLSGSPLAQDGLHSRHKRFLEV